jgi:diguanylate cyclase (GGDEF)-like protein
MKQYLSNLRRTGGGRGVVEMIVLQCGTGEILEALCADAGACEDESQTAFFLLNGDTWTLGAKGGLTTESEAALARISPEELSLSLLDQSDGLFDEGWACHLLSGTGEILGMFVHLSRTPAAPAGQHARLVTSACYLAVLTIEQKNLLDDLTWQADHDAVTGVYTRRCFDRILGRQLDVSPCSAALLYIGLNRFRLVNDVLGHAMGNRVLKLVGRRFQSALGAHDALARAGGDEFMAILADAGKATDTADSLLHSLDEPFTIGGHELVVSASIGISYSCEGITGEALEREARIALYHAKQAGGSSRMPFHPSMAATQPERLEMEKRLRVALAGGEMLVHYQPQIDFLSGAMTGAEALLRWQPEGLGIISPASFVPILEETGLILEFGRWVLRETCRQGLVWAEENGRLLRLAVNVSAMQFADAGFVEDLKQILSETGFPPKMLELELTESIIVSDYGRACRIFGELRKTGIALALDDFGKGQSSLAYLREMRFDTLKVDRSFITPIEEGKTCCPILENILKMVKSLGMTSVAEGIETQYQAKELRAMGCDLAQGYLYSPPLPPLEFAEFMVKDSQTVANLVSCVIEQRTSMDGRIGHS